MTQLSYVFFKVVYTQLSGAMQERQLLREIYWHVVVQVLAVLATQYWEEGKPRDTPKCGYANEFCAEPEKSYTCELG